MFKILGAEIAMDPTEAMYQCASVLSSKDVATTSSSDSNNACSSHYVSQSQSPISNENSESSPTVKEQSLVRHRSSLAGNPHRQLKREMSIVKGPTLDFSPLMTLLQPHTDLNKPPPNWLRRRPPQQRQQGRQFFWPKSVSRYKGKLYFFCTCAPSS